MALFPGVSIVHSMGNRELYLDKCTIYYYHGEAKYRGEMTIWRMFFRFSGREKHSVPQADFLSSVGAVLEEE